MTIKKLMCAVACGALVFGLGHAAPRKTVKWTSARADEPCVRYTGRTAVSEEGAVSFDWSGVTLRVAFDGSTLKMDCKAIGKNLFNLWIDRQLSYDHDKVVALYDCDTLVTIVSGLGKGRHEIILQKRCEGEQGEMVVKSFMTDGVFAEPTPAPSRFIEVIGDSYTCGYGTESERAGDPFSAETENCNLAYGEIIARYFNAECALISHSGLGIARNYGGSPRPTMTVRYSQTFDERRQDAWDFSKSSYRPDVVVIYLGTNDFSTGEQPGIDRFVAEYHKLIDKIKAAYGEDVPVLCAASKADVLMGQYIEKVALSCPHANVHWMSIQPSAHNMALEGGDLGASWHPNYKGQKKVAMCMIPYIATITGWNLEDKAVE